METNSISKVQVIQSGNIEPRKNDIDGAASGRDLQVLPPPRGYTGEVRKDGVTRPCAVIGPDPSYGRKDEVSHAWGHPNDSGSAASSYYPPAYYPPRNISPRLSFQENMNRIVVQSPSELKGYPEYSDPSKCANPNIAKFNEGPVLVKPPPPPVDMLQSSYYDYHAPPPPVVDYQRHADYQGPRIQVIKGAQMFPKAHQQSPYIFPTTPNYPCKAYTRFSNVRYDPYSQYKEKYAQAPRYNYAAYQYPPHISSLSAIEKFTEAKKHLEQTADYPVRYFPTHPSLPAASTDYHAKIPPPVPKRRHTITTHYSEGSAVPTQAGLYTQSQAKLHNYTGNDKGLAYNHNVRGAQDTRGSQHYYSQYTNLSYQEARLVGESVHNTYSKPVPFPPMPPNVVTYPKPIEPPYTDRPLDYDPYYRYYQKPQQPAIPYNPLENIPTQFSPNIISPAESSVSCNSGTTLPPQSLEDGGYVSQCSTSSGRSSNPNAANVVSKEGEGGAKEELNNNCVADVSHNKKSDKNDNKKSLKQFYSTWVMDELEETSKSQEASAAVEGFASGESTVGVADLNVASVPPNNVYSTGKHLAGPSRGTSLYPTDKTHVPVPTCQYYAYSQSSLSHAPTTVHSISRTSTITFPNTVYSAPKPPSFSQPPHAGERSNVSVPPYASYYPEKPASNLSNINSGIFHPQYVYTPERMHVASNIVKGNISSAAPGSYQGGKFDLAVPSCGVVDKSKVPAYTTYSNVPSSHAHAAYSVPGVSNSIDKSNSLTQNYYKYTSNISKAINDNTLYHSHLRNNPTSESILASGSSKNVASTTSSRGLGLSDGTLKPGNGPEASNMNELIDVEAKISQSIIHKDVAHNSGAKPIEMKIEIAPGYNPTCVESTAADLINGDPSLKTNHTTRNSDGYSNIVSCKTVQPQHSSKPNKAEHAGRHNKNMLELEHHKAKQSQPFNNNKDKTAISEKNASLEIGPIQGPPIYDKSSAPHLAASDADGPYKQNSASTHGIVSQRDALHNQTSLSLLNREESSLNHSVIGDGTAQINNSEKCHKNIFENVVKYDDNHRPASCSKGSREEGSAGAPVHETVLKYVSTSNIQHTLMDLSHSKVKANSATTEDVDIESEINYAVIDMNSDKTVISKTNPITEKLCGPEAKQREKSSDTGGGGSSAETDPPTGEQVIGAQQTCPISEPYQLCGDVLSSNYLERTKSIAGDNKCDLPVKSTNNIIKHNIDNIILTNTIYKYTQDFDSQIVATDLSIKNYDHFEYIPKINHKNDSELVTVDTPLKTPEIIEERLEEMGFTSKRTSMLRSSYEPTDKQNSVNGNNSCGSQENVPDVSVSKVDSDFSCKNISESDVIKNNVIETMASINNTKVDATESTDNISKQLNAPVENSVEETNCTSTTPTNTEDRENMKCETAKCGDQSLENKTTANDDSLVLKSDPSHKLVNCEANTDDSIERAEEVIECSLQEDCGNQGEKADITFYPNITDKTHELIAPDKDFDKLTYTDNLSSDLGAEQDDKVSETSNNISLTHEEFEKVPDGITLSPQDVESLTYLEENFQHIEAQNCQMPQTEHNEDSNKINDSQSTFTEKIDDNNSESEITVAKSFCDEDNGCDDVHVTADILQDTDTVLADNVDTDNKDIDHSIIGDSECDAKGCVEENSPLVSSSTEVMEVSLQCSDSKGSGPGELISTEESPEVQLQITNDDQEKVSFDDMREHIESQYQSFQLTIDPDLLSTDGNVLYCQIEPTSPLKCEENEEKYYLEVDTLADVIQRGQITVIPCDGPCKGSEVDKQFTPDDNCAPWIDDVACVETVISQEPLCEDKDESQEAYSPEPLWGPNSVSSETNVEEELSLTPTSNENHLISEDSKDADYRTLINADSMLDNNIGENELENLSLAMNTEDHSASNFAETFLKTATSLDPPRCHYDQELMSVLMDDVDACKQDKQDLINVLLGEVESGSPAESNTHSVSSFPSGQEVSYVPNKTIRHCSSDGDNSQCSGSEDSDSGSSSSDAEVCKQSQGGLVTKGAQKYIPPLDASHHNFKCQLVLPPEKLLFLKKLSEKKKIDSEKSADKITIPQTLDSSRNQITKKVKPKFDDVLKNIDESNLTWCKKKLKRNLKSSSSASIPKMVIKKTDEGSLYTTKIEENDGSEGKTIKLHIKAIPPAATHTHTKCDNVTNADAAAELEKGGSGKRRGVSTRSDRSDFGRDCLKKSVSRHNLKRSITINDPHQPSSVEREPGIRSQCRESSRNKCNTKQDGEGEESSIKRNRISQRRQTIAYDSMSTTIHPRCSKSDKKSKNKDPDDSVELIHKQQTTSDAVLPAGKISRRRQTFTVNHSDGRPKSTCSGNAHSEMENESKIPARKAKVDSCQELINDLCPKSDKKTKAKAVDDSVEVIDQQQSGLSNADSPAGKISQRRKTFAVNYSDRHVDGRRTKPGCSEMDNVSKISTCKAKIDVCENFIDEAEDLNHNLNSLNNNVPKQDHWEFPKPNTKLRKRSSTVCCDPNEVKRHSSPNLHSENRKTKKGGDSCTSQVLSTNERGGHKHKERQGLRRQEESNHLNKSQLGMSPKVEKFHKREGNCKESSITDVSNITFIRKIDSSIPSEATERSEKDIIGSQHSNKKINQRRMTISYASPFESDCDSKCEPSANTNTHTGLLYKRRMTVCYDTTKSDNDDDGDGASTKSHGSESDEEDNRTTESKVKPKRYRSDKQTTVSDNLKSKTNPNVKFKPLSKSNDTENAARNTQHTNKMNERRPGATACGPNKEFYRPSTSATNNKVGPQRSKSRGPLRRHSVLDTPNNIRENIPFYKRRSNIDKTIFSCDPEPYVPQKVMRRDVPVSGGSDSIFSLFPRQLESFFNNVGLDRRMEDRMSPYTYTPSSHINDSASESGDEESDNSRSQGHGEDSSQENINMDRVTISYDSSRQSQNKISHRRMTFCYDNYVKQSREKKARRRSVDDKQSPDTTGKRWQPFVSLRKNIIVEEMIKKNKSKISFYGESSPRSSNLSEDSHSVENDLSNANTSWSDCDGGSSDSADERHHTKYLPSQNCKR